VLVYTNYSSPFSLISLWLLRYKLLNMVFLVCYFYLLLVRYISKFDSYQPMHCSYDVTSLLCLCWYGLFSLILDIGLLHSLQPRYTRICNYFNFYAGSPYLLYCNSLLNRYSGHSYVTLMWLNSQTSITVICLLVIHLVYTGEAL